LLFVFGLSSARSWASHRTTADAFTHAHNGTEMALRF